MRNLWRRTAERIDAASLRERALMFVAAAAVLVAVLNTALIEPQFARDRLLTREIAQKQSEMKLLQEQIEKLARRREQGAAGDDRSRLDRVRAELRQVTDELLERQRSFATPQQVSKVVEELLARNRGLSLVEMKNLPVTDLKGTPVAEAKADAGKGSAAERPAAFRHGIEITVSGPYLDLLAYLAALEKLPTQVFWGKLELTAVDPAATTLKLTIYTLSLEQAWMVV